MSALAGIRVLDFGQVIIGAVCGQVLADHGADVVKIERPGTGDLSRSFAPFLNGESLPAISVNRGKRSLAVDLKTPEGCAIARRLAATADVLLENFRPGVMEQLGLGYEQLSAENPRLVYATGSGYGTRGPLAEERRPGHELLVQALTGLAWKNEVDGMPRALPTTAVDFSGGMLLAQGILLALIARGRTGRGQRVEVALTDAAMALQQWDLSGLMNTGVGGGVDNHLSPLQAIYRTGDGFIAVVGWFRPNPVGNLCSALGLSDLSS
ncbi:MAG TPA: CoA transferase, partial [Chloroflexota bacterium]|nr:CoA transferase [Chloroflexota bacterium]